MIRRYSRAAGINSGSHGCDNLRPSGGPLSQPPVLGPTMTLTEQQSLAVIHATRPLQSHERTALLAALEAMLAGRSDVGDGELSRLLRELQRKHFHPPG